MKTDKLSQGLVLVLGLALLGFQVSRVEAQDLGPGVLPQRVPKTPEKPPGTAPEVKPPPVETEATVEEEPAVIEKLNGIVVVGNTNLLKVEPIPAFDGVRVLGVPLLSGPDFPQRVKWYLGQKMTVSDLKDLEKEIILYAREKGHPLVDIILPSQELSSGVIQLIFLEGRVGQVTVENKGKKWFKDDLIRREVRLHPGDTVELNKLREDMDWVNRNPFRQVNTVFRAGKELGQTDIALDVEDRLPLRLFGGYENTGTEFTGADRLVAGLNWGNAFGVDHQFNFQYTTDIDFKTISAYSGSYLIPLPWRHNVAVFGAYADTTVEPEPGAPKVHGQSYQGSGRYAIPLRVSKNYLQEFSLGFDYKRSNNDFEFGGTTGIGSSSVEVDQFQAGYSGLLIDPWGQTSFGLEGFFSPGGMTPDNEDFNFEQLRPGSIANYIYGRFTLERITMLPAQFSWIVRFFGQYSTARLTPSEEIGIGGFGTVRGYNERFANADDGFVINNEVRTKPLSLGKTIMAPLQGQDYLQFLAFFDYGSVYIKDFNSSDASLGFTPVTTLASVGLGLRYTVRQNLSVRFDYGFQLMDRESHHSGGHVGVLLSY